MLRQPVYMNRLILYSLFDHIDVIVLFLHADRMGILILGMMAGS